MYCVETAKKYVKAASGSGVFLSNPSETNGVIVTNAHVARHLLDSNKIVNDLNILVALTEKIHQK